MQVEQFVLDILDSSTTTDNVGLNGNLVTLLDGCGYGDGSWAATNATTFKLPIIEFALHKLRVMGGNIDVGWVEFS